MSCSHFPTGAVETKPMKNPAIQLFGNRLFSDQTVSELLVEFLLVVFSRKKTGEIEVQDPLPTWEQLARWEADPLRYAPRARLNLKLFSFIGASRLDSRHQTHREHYRHLINTLRDRIHANDDNRDEVVRTLENLFLGFQGAGSGRTWCAQSFLPVSPQFLARESIWKEKKAKRDQVEDWDSLFNRSFSYFDMNQHLFLARGGELLYLQLCQALRQTAERIAFWNRKNDLGLTDNELNPAWLHEELSRSLTHLMDHCPATLNKLADFIDRGLDLQTARRTDYDGDKRRFVKAGWCHAESWQEGYLFGVALRRLLQNSLDVVDRVHLLEHLCAMQALRTLALRSAQVLKKETTCWPGYRLVVSAPEEKRPAIRRLSQQSLKAVEKQIFRALRGPEVQLPDDPKERDKYLNQADKSYGGKLFISLAKRIGLVVPKRGAGARFVMNEQILRLLVFTTVSPGERLTFDTFKKRLENCWGIVFDASGLDKANQWLNSKSLYLPADTDEWLQEMLAAAGFLIHLSDSCALVHNPAGIREEER